jgi:hypothetical protein
MDEGEPDDTFERYLQSIVLCLLEMVKVGSL